MLVREILLKPQNFFWAFFATALVATTRPQDELDTF